jgi:mannonate dehydratase
MKLAEMVPPGPDSSALRRLVVQAGVRWAIGGLPETNGPDRRGTDKPWDYAPLLSMKQRYESAGLGLAAIEARPPLVKAKRGLPGRGEEIDVVCTLIENMGRLGIPVWCYEWMSDFNWLRTNTAVPSRGGSLVSGYNHALMEAAPPTEHGPLSEETLWESLEYFLRRVVPVAEKANVKLAMHPDDPPLSPIRGVGRIMRSVENYQRLLDLVPSPVNGITLCQGNFRLMTDDIPSVIKKFGQQEKIFFVHFRDVRGTVVDFVETWHDDGPTDLLECLRTYHEVGFDGPMRPDHVPTVEGDSNAHPGYSLYGRLFALGYIRGMMESIGR